MGTYEKNHNLVILVPQLVIHATAGMTIWGTKKNIVAGAPYFSIVRE